MRGRPVGDGARPLDVGVQPDQHEIPAQRGAIRLEPAPAAGEVRRGERLDVEAALDRRGKDTDDAHTTPTFPRMRMVPGAEPKAHLSGHRFPRRAGRPTAGGPGAAREPHGQAGWNRSSHPPKARGRVGRVGLIEAGRAARGPEPGETGLATSAPRFPPAAPRAPAFPGRGFERGVRRPRHSPFTWIRVAGPVVLLPRTAFHPSGRCGSVKSKSHAPSSGETLRHSALMRCP